MTWRFWEIKWLSRMTQLTNGWAKTLIKSLDSKSVFLFPVVFPARVKWGSILCKAFHYFTGQLWSFKNSWRSSLFPYNFKNFDRTLNSVYYLKDTMWRTFQIVTHLTLITITWNRYYYYHHFSDKKTRATSKWQRWNLSQTKLTCFQSSNSILPLTSLVMTSF